MGETATLPLANSDAATARPRGMQPAVVIVAAAVLGAGAIHLGMEYGARRAALFLIGAAFGVVLYHAAFGFTAAYRALVARGAGAGVRAQCLMLAVATVLFAPLLAAGSVFGTELGGAVAPAGVSVLVGAFVFAIGMQLGGGCGSGALFHLGSGVPSLAITLVGFIAGSVIATFHAPFWSDTPSLGAVALSETLGWPVAVIAQLAVLGALAAISWWFERRQSRDVADRARPSRTGLARLYRGPWSLTTGAIALAVLNTLTLVIAGHPWGIVWAFTLWGGKLLQATGYDLSSVPFWSGEFQQAALDAPALADVTSVMDTGIVLGALAAAGLAGRFRPARRIAPAVVVAGIVGGLLLGYGSRIAYGCNIGALFSGIASTSLHGWLWGAAALAGTPIGVWLRRRFRLPD